TCPPTQTQIYLVIYEKYNIIIFTARKLQKRQHPFTVHPSRHIQSYSVNCLRNIHANLITVDVHHHPKHHHHHHRSRSRRRRRLRHHCKSRTTNQLVMY
ncbi:unnamed protein product, partial [Schistosoma mattheei]